MRCQRLSLVATVAVSLGIAQAPGPGFEVAAIKPGGDLFSTRPEMAAGRFHWTTQLAYLVGFAYGLDTSRVSGPSLGNAYAVEATFDPSASPDDVRLMVRRLLIERFGLEVHRVSRESDGYAMVASSGRLKIDPAQDAAGVPTVSSTLPARGVVQVTERLGTMADLAMELQRVLGTPVWDRTGIAGRYSFEFRYARDLNAGNEIGAPWVGTALEETLGLKLEKSKGPVETLVIDRVKEPSEN